MDKVNESIQQPHDTVVDSAKEVVKSEEEGEEEEEGEKEEEEEDDEDDEESCSQSSTSLYGVLMRGDRKREATRSFWEDSSDESDGQTDPKASLTLSLKLPEPDKPADTNIKFWDLRRYLRAARLLYEIQHQMKRPSAILRMKPNYFGFKNGSTFDALAALVSPLRSRQTLDDWSAREISTFEEAFERFGKNFHAISSELPHKTVKDTIGFYYIWKKHGSCSRTRYTDDFGSPTDDFLPEPEPDVSSATLKKVDLLRKRQARMRDYFEAARNLYSPKVASHNEFKRIKLSDFGLQRVTSFQPAISNNSPLRSPAVIDSWTPFEIRVFEVSMECFGKEFHRIANAVGTKTCRDVIAFYYIWKMDSHYQVVKNRWKKNDPRSTQKPVETAVGTSTG